MSGGFDVLVLGEILVELSAPEPLRSARSFDLSFSGDALNAAAAAAAAGAAVGLLACVGDDDLGEALIDRVRELGIDTSLLRRVYHKYLRFGRGGRLACRLRVQSQG